MSLRYYVLGSIVLVCALYFSKEMRDLFSSLPSLPLPSLSSLPTSSSFPSWQSEPLVASPRHQVSDVKQVLDEKTDLEKWIQSRLTQQGLKEMTEAGYWQSEHSQAL